MDQLASSTHLAEAVKRELAKALYHIRLAGYLLVFNLSDAQTASVTTSIVSVDDIVALGAFYDRHFVRTCKISQSVIFSIRSDLDLLVSPSHQRSYTSTVQSSLATFV